VILHEEVCQLFIKTRQDSTALALIDVVDSIYQYLHHNETVIGLYLDLQKAFDTVSHKILLQKVNNYGVRGIVLDWLNSYLSGRKQFTVNNCDSEITTINCAVPQGSVLGPLLFIIYVYCLMIYVMLLAKLKLNCLLMIPMSLFTAKINKPINAVVI